MKIKYASILSATAVALLLLSATAQAHGHGGHGGLCSAATLKGAVSGWLADNGRMKR
ncbi:hypothetical protein SAMN05446935_8040 [Burkholderia sp. YR290]|nr:hypothetical protein SAMN05446935_8040 [Burkholderia sp. YR290]